MAQSEPFSLNQFLVLDIIKISATVWQHVFCGMLVQVTFKQHFQHCNAKSV